jgi:hypothetical protein
MLLLLLCGAFYLKYILPTFISSEVLKEELEIIEPTISRQNFNHLVLVAGHAVYIGDFHSVGLNREEDWFLEPFQKGQAATFVEHIKLGNF